jgi:hypothetical protein
MSLWPHRKRSVCQLNATSRRCKGEIKGWEGQLKSAKKMSVSVQARWPELNKVFAR